MKFPLSIDVRKKTINAQLGAGIVVIDADQVHVMTIMPDEHGYYSHAGDVVDLLNLVHKLQKVPL
jgi:ribosomal protein L13